MREILFRGLRKDGKGWVYGWLKSWKHFNGIGYERVYSIYDEESEFLVIPETVGQYIGINDKNGVKIFEGDKCILFNHHPSWENMVYEIIFIYGAFSLKPINKNGHAAFCKYISDCIMNDVFFNDESELFEVIGNIHESRIATNKN